MLLQTQPKPQLLDLSSGFETISVVGLGYIGLPTAALFASCGLKVIGVDISSHVVDTVNRGQIHIVEPDLDSLVAKVVKEGFLFATTSPQAADAFLIAVPTPFKDGHKPDLSYIEAAAKAIAPLLKEGDLVVLESTSPVGSTAQMSAWLAQTRPDLSFPGTHGEQADVQVAYCPERVLPGKVIQELVSNDRVIGGLTRKASAMAVDLYKTFVAGNCIVTNARTAEMCKLTENSFRDVNIAFANELSMICDELDINVWELTALANRHPRVNILQPGPGVGGHCIAVDPWFIVDASPKQAKLIRTAREVNDSKPLWVIEKTKDAILNALAEMPTKRMRDIKVACLGLAFKPNIDDLRGSPALEIAKHLSQMGCEVMAVEPHLETTPLELLEHNISLRPLQTALWHADVVCVLVKHQALIDQVDMIQSHTAVVDAVGILN